MAAASRRALLALDFDGVLFDSAPECYWVARGTADGRDPTDPPPDAEAIRRDPGFAAFLAWMPLGNRAEDFGVALRGIAAGERPADQDGYDAFKARCGAAWQEDFHRRFYTWRGALAAAHPEAWLALMRPYPGVGAALRRLAARFELAIATSKDRASVRAVLGAHGLDALFAEQRILDKETGRSKAAHLRELCARSGLAPEAAVFVDDKVNHLDRVAPLGVHCALAAWGYNGGRERALARRRGYLVWGLADFETGLAALGDRIAGP